MNYLLGFANNIYLFYFRIVISQGEKDLVGRITVIAAFFMPYCRGTIDTVFCNIPHSADYQCES
jgi:hypothetical protein